MAARIRGFDPFQIESNLNLKVLNRIRIDLTSLVRFDSMQRTETLCLESNRIWVAFDSEALTPKSRHFVDFKAI
jgi:hypothetical protein